MANRIRGQEVEVLLVVNNVPQDTITDVRSFEMEAQLEIQTEGYLGETTMRRDEIYNGVRGRLELHFENADVLALMRSIILRAQRREPGTQINIKATLAFDDGNRSRVVIEGASFGSIPMSFGSRADYGTISLDFEAPDFSVI